MNILYRILYRICISTTQPLYYISITIPNHQKGVLLLLKSKFSCLLSSGVISSSPVSGMSYYVLVSLLVAAITKGSVVSSLPWRVLRALLIAHIEVVPDHLRLFNSIMNQRTHSNSNTKGKEHMSRYAVTFLSFSFQQVMSNITWTGAFKSH